MYAPIARISIIRVLIAFTSIYKSEIHQMNVKNSFLNNKLDEEIYMQQSERFMVQDKEHKVCKLVKLFYGLKQVSKQ